MYDGGGFSEPPSAAAAESVEPARDGEGEREPQPRGRWDEPAAAEAEARAQAGAQGNAFEEDEEDDDEDDEDEENDDLEDMAEIGSEEGRSPTGFGRAASGSRGGRRSNRAAASEALPSALEQRALQAIEQEYDEAAEILRMSRDMLREELRLHGLAVTGSKVRAAGRRALAHSARARAPCAHAPSVLTPP